MNTQEIFDKVVRHLASMQEPSVNALEVCAYRGKGGAMCAVGCLISDEVYAKCGRDIEGETISLPSVQTAVADSLGRALGKDEIQMLRNLQNLHDDADLWWDENGLNFAGWKRIHNIAVAFNLTCEGPAIT